MVTSILAMNDPKNPSRPDSSMAPFFTGLAVFIYGITFSLNTGYAINPARGMFEMSYKNYCRIFNPRAVGIRHFKTCWPECSLENNSY